MGYRETGILDRRSKGPGGHCQPGPSSMLPLVALEEWVGGVWRQPPTNFATSPMRSCSLPEPV